MSVVLLADRTATAAPGPRVLVSPLAELGAALHQLSSVDHGDSRWVARTWAGLPEKLRSECDLFSATWGGYRSRLLLPLASPADGIAGELTRIAALPLETFTALSAYALAGTDRRDAADISPGWLCKRARGRGCGPAADLLVADAATFRSRFLAVLESCWAAFFAAEWQVLAPRLSLAAARARQLLDGAEPVRGLGRLIPASRLAGAPDRLIIDKLAHAVVDLARTGLLLVPSVLGEPHLLVKHETGLPAVVQFPAGRPQDQRPPVPSQVLTARLRMLSEPVPLRVCRMLARHPRSTQELADTLRMSAPEMSRQLRALREAGMVSTERQGRFVLYTLRHEAVASLGADLLNLLLR